MEYNYKQILEWSRNICKGDELYQDLAHYAIETFMLHDRYDEIMERETNEPTTGHARAFLLSIMRNSWYGAKSEFSRYYKAHRADIGQRKRNIDPDDFENRINSNYHEYNFEQDRLTEAITGILEEMAISDQLLWYNSKLFQMWLDQPNYSEISRQTGIPRTSISKAVEETKNYIKTELKNRNIDYDF